MGCVVNPLNYKNYMKFVDRSDRYEGTKCVIIMATLAVWFACTDKWKLLYVSKKKYKI